MNKREREDMEYLEYIKSITDKCPYETCSVDCEYRGICQNAKCPLNSLCDTE